MSPAGSEAAPARREGGFVLLFTILMLLGVSAVSVGMVFNAHHGEVAALNYKNRLIAFYASDGLRAVLAQEILDGKGKAYLDTSEIGSIEGDLYESLGGNTVDDLRAVLGNPPTKKLASDYLGSNLRYATDYGIRWSGYLMPPASGSYTFLLRCDDACALHLSPDENPGNLSAAPAARIDFASGVWPISGAGTSPPVPLKVGKRYYFEFLHKQAGSKGVGQVGWRGPNFLVERPIPGKRLASAVLAKENWDTAKVDDRLVKYSVIQAGPLIFNINTEAVTGGIGDSSYSAAQQQTLDMGGESLAPKDSLWQRVIFYDMHSDRSNPEFERGDPDFYGGLATQNMVRTKGLQYTTENAAYFGMDSIGKPLPGTNIKWNCGVTKWFTPWKPGWFKTYGYAGGQTDCTESNVGHDTAFKNIVFMDSLLFLRRNDLGANVYQFKDSSGSSIGMDFDPLNGRGYGNDIGWGTNNFSFCMEMHSQFEHSSGMVFEFDGDDDVWLYINDSLVLDLGFVHPSKYETIELDDLPLKYGETYNLDFFYCERQSAGSSIDIITNLPVLQTRGRPRSNWKRDYGELD